MSREEVQAFLRNFQLGLDGLQKQIDDSLRKLPEVPKADLPKFLSEQKTRWLRFHEEQLDEWASFASETGLEVEEEALDCASASNEAAAGVDAASPSPFKVQLRSLEQRVAAMGGIPALGALVLPRMTPGQKVGLQATASPAAVEIMRGRLGSDVDVRTPLRRSSASEPEVTLTPMVTLRKTSGLSREAAPAAGGAGGSGLFGTPGGAAPPGSELAAAIQRRATQRQAAAAAAVGEGPAE